MCYVTATEFKNNMKYYMELSNKENVYITKNGKTLTVLVNPKMVALNDFLKLAGTIDAEVFEGKDYNEIIGEEIIERTK